jgi:hypothetical protein
MIYHPQAMESSLIDHAGDSRQDVTDGGYAAMPYFVMCNSTFMC